MPDFDANFWNRFYREFIIPRNRTKVFAEFAVASLDFDRKKSLKESGKFVYIFSFTHLTEGVHNTFGIIPLKLSLPASLTSPFFSSVLSSPLISFVAVVVAVFVSFLFIVFAHLFSSLLSSIVSSSLLSSHLLSAYW